MTRLCYFADPISTHTVKWVAYFARDPRYEVHLMGWSPPTDPALSRVIYHHLPDEMQQPFPAPVRSALWHGRLWGLAQIRQFQLLLDAIQPDIFDILMINAPEIPAALARKGPLVLTPWGSDLLVYPQSYSMVMRQLLRVVMRRADLVLCNSLALTQAAQTFGVRQDHIRPVGQIVDLARFRPGLDARPYVEKLGLNGGPVLLSPRLILPNYAIETAIDALAAVRCRHPAAKLVQLGDRGLDPAYTAKLDARIQELGLHDAVIFPGRMSYQEMPYMFALADVVLSIPYSDSRASSIYEAMACGVPVVTSDLAANREIVAHRETGWVAPAGDSNQVAEAIIGILADEVQRRDIIQRAYKYVCREGDYETQMARVAQYYREILD